MGLVGFGELGDGVGGEEEEVGAGVVVVLDVAPAGFGVDGVEALLDVVEGDVALAVGGLVERDEEGGDEGRVVAGEAVGDEVLAAGGDVAAGALGLLAGEEFGEGGVGVGVGGSVAAEAAVGDFAVEGAGEAGVEDEDDVRGGDAVDVAHDGLVREQGAVADVVLDEQGVGGDEEAFAEVGVEVAVAGEEDEELVLRLELAVEVFGELGEDLVVGGVADLFDMEARRAR